jgi:two-component system chemotaxis sensor kinase CheA
MSSIPLDDFILEANEIIEISETNLLELEKEMNADLIDTLFRNMHNLKGSAALYDLTAISRLTHALEDSLEKYRDDSSLSLAPESIDLILSTIDFIKNMILEVQVSGSDSKFKNEVAPQDFQDTFEF